MVDSKPLGITKKFYWKPGAYQTVQKIVINTQRLLKKAQSLTKVVSRARDYSYSLRNLQTTIQNIETQLFNFRATGVLFQDNTDDIIEYCNILYNKMIEQAEICSEFATITVEDVHDNSLNLIDHRICITYKYRDPKIQYRLHQTGISMGEIECPGTVFITIKLSVCRYINLIASNNGSLDGISLNSFRNNNSPVKIGGNYVNEYYLEHPYIAQNRSSWGSHEHFTDDWKYVCVGNLEEEIKACIQSLDFMSLKIFIDRLVTHFDTQTGPLNRIGHSYHGKPRSLEGSDDFYSAVGMLTDVNNCSYRHNIYNMLEDGYSASMIKEDSYCESYCTLKSTFSIYKEATKEMSKEEIERIAIGRATINAATRRVQ